MITDRRAAEQLNACVASLSGRAAEFLYETSSQCGRRSHAWPVVRRAHFRSKASNIDCGSGTEKNLPKVIGRYDFPRLKHRERRLQDRSEHLRHGQSI
jgi:hypothetical protein